MTSRTDYQVWNARGVAVHTFDEPGAAHRWAEAHEEAYGALEVFAVTVTTTRRRVDARGRYAPAKARQTPTTGALHDQG